MQSPHTLPTPVGLDSASAGRGGQGQQPAAPRPSYAAAQMQSPHTLPTPVGLDSASAGGARSGLGRRRSHGHLVLNCILEQKPRGGTLIQSKITFVTYGGGRH